MPYEVGWLVPRRVVAVRVTGDLVLPEIELGSREVIALLDSSEAPAHIVIDISRMKSYPVRVSTLVDSSTYLRHPHVGWLVIYGVSNFVLEVVISTLGKLARVRLRKAASQAEAFQFLARQDPTVSGLLSAQDAASANNG